jgi:hypothetical protein
MFFAVHCNLVELLATWLGSYEYAVQEREKMKVWRTWAKPCPIYNLTHAILNIFSCSPKTSYECHVFSSVFDIILLVKVIHVGDEARICSAFSYNLVCKLGKANKVNGNSLS